MPIPTSTSFNSLAFRAAYEKTLAVHHPWVVQKAAKLAMNLLPTKNGLILKGRTRAIVSSSFREY
jgi:hypothetical protein